MIGTVVYFDSFWGIGLISPDGDHEDVQVHMSALDAAGLQTLIGAERIGFDIVTNRHSGRKSAENLKIL